MAGISLKIHKCGLFQPKVHYLVHVISPGRFRGAQTAANAFKTFTFPRTLKLVGSFLEAGKFYHCSVIGFARNVRPLTEKTRNYSNSGCDNPNALQGKTFDGLKD